MCWGGSPSLSGLSARPRLLHGEHAEIKALEGGTAREGQGARRCSLR